MVRRQPWTSRASLARWEGASMPNWVPRPEKVRVRDPSSIRYRYLTAGLVMIFCCLRGMAAEIRGDTRTSLEVLHTKSEPGALVPMACPLPPSPK